MNQSLVLNTLALLQQCHGLSPQASLVALQVGLKLTSVPLRYLFKVRFALKLFHFSC